MVVGPTARHPVSSRSAGLNGTVSRRRRPLRLRLVLMLLAVAALVLAPALSPPVVLAAPAVPLPPQTNLPVTEGQVTASLDSLAPEVLSGGEDLVVTGTIANGTTTPLTDPVLVVQVQQSTPVSASELSSWLAGNRDVYLRTALIETLPTTIQPGESTGFSLTVPAASLPLSDPGQWGPRGVQVAVTQDHVSLAADRSYLLWQQADETQPTGVLALLPVTASPAELQVLSRLKEPRWSPPEPSATAAPGTPSPGQTAEASPSAGPAQTPEPGTPAATAAPEAPPEQVEADALLTAMVTRMTALLELAQPGVVLGVDPAVLEVLGVLQEEPAAAADSTPAPAVGAPDSPAPEGGVQATAVAPGGEQPEQDASAQPSPAPSGSPAPSPTASPGSKAAPSPVAVLRERLVAAVAAGDVVALPWADADEAALAHAGESTLLAQAHSRADASALAGLGARRDVSWPAATALDQQTLSALPASSTLVLAPPGSLEVSEDLTYTPSGVTTVDGRVLLLPDTAASATVQAVLPPGAGVVDPAKTTLNELDSRQLLRAQTAIMARQLPLLSRDLVVSVDRVTATGTDPQVLGARLQALTSSPWTVPLGLEDLRQHAAVISQASRGSWPREVQRTPLGQASPEGNEISVEELAAARDSATTLAAVGSTVPSPEELLGQEAEVVSWAVSSAWRANPALRGQMLSQVQGSAQQLRTAINPQPSSTINLISQQANLPVRIGSSLTQDATVQVTLESSSTRLQPDGPVTATIPASGEAMVLVPVKAVGSGDVMLTINVKAPDGSQVSTPATVHIRVHAEWESLGTRVLTGVLVVLLVVGVIRTVRRGRRSSGVQQAGGGPDSPGPLTLREDPL